MGIAKDKDFEESSGNVFKDLGFSDPALEDLKAQMALKIFSIIKQKKSSVGFKGEKELNAGSNWKIIWDRTTRNFKIKKWPIFSF